MPLISDPLAIELELLSEKASALRSVAHRLESLLAQLAELEAELAHLPNVQRLERLELHEHLRQQAEYQRWCLIVQREAMGMRNHQDVYEFYPVPPRLKG